MTRVVEAEALTKIFGNGTKAVDAVSFTIERGQTFGLVGESGSGKSTVAAMLLRLEDATSGRVKFNGDDITKATGDRLRGLRRHMQLVMQDPVSALNRRKTVRQIIGLPIQIYEKASSKEIEKRVLHLLDLVSLPASFIERYPHELSGGQCQRIGIARALALSPDFIVLDESVSAIDVLVQAQILNLLKELQRDLGLTYLFVSHDLAVVRYMASHIAVMHNGEIVEHGTRDKVFHHPEDPYTRALIAAAPASLAKQHLGQEVSEEQRLEEGQ